MLTRKTLLFLTVLLAVMFYMTPRYEAEAIDPVTMAILAPIAIQAAKIMAPYVIRALGNMARVFLRASVHLVELFLLPVGLVESTIFCRWRFRHGLMHMWTGLCGPFKFCGWM